MHTFPRQELSLYDIHHSAQLVATEWFGSMKKEAEKWLACFLFGREADDDVYWLQRLFIALFIPIPQTTNLIQCLQSKLSSQ